jgi:ssDNA thymidine ADP-ribosyltransferase, DarT
MKETYWGDTREDGDRRRRRMAEFLVHKFFPFSLVSAIVTQSTDAPSHFGPYAQTIDQFISFVEGHFIFDYGDGSSGSKATLTIDADAIRQARDALGEDQEFQAALDRLSQIVDGLNSHTESSCLPLFTTSLPMSPIRQPWKALSLQYVIEPSL